MNSTASFSPICESTQTTPPLTATTIGKGLGRSAGAVANCLARLAKEGKVRQAKKRPRAYIFKEVKSK